MVETGVPGDPGLNVTSPPELSTAVHWLAEGHATPSRELPPSAVMEAGVPGDPGLNVTSPPELSTAVHWPAEGHATDTKL